MNPLRVLLVDDEPDQILLARAYLSTADPAVSVESSASAPEALKQLENQSFDRIVSDYLMTDMNGLELCVTLRERGVQTPFTLFTGRGSEEVAEKAFQVGVDDYLRKEKSPSVYTVLVRNIRSLVGKHRAERTLRENEKLSFAFNSSVSITYLDRDLHDVLDTGVGITEEAAKSLFEPLFTTKRGGMGLGLYFVRMAVEAHGGGVGFASRPGEGTTFKVTLP